MDPTRQSAGHATFARLRDGIATGRWAPGARLPSERDLSEQFGVSRQILREAVQRLVGQGLVEVRPRRGLFVVAVSSEDFGDAFERLIGTDFDRVNELLDLRRVLERRSAYLAAEFATRADLATLGGVFKEMERAIKAGETGEHEDVRFHCAIASAAGNTVLTHLMATLHGALSKAAWLLASRLMESTHYRDGMFDLHARIFQTIRAREPADAADAMDAHFDFVLREFSQYRRKVGDI